MLGWSTEGCRRATKGIRMRLEMVGRAHDDGGPIGQIIGPYDIARRFLLDGTTPSSQGHSKAKYIRKLLKKKREKEALTSNARPNQLRTQLVHWHVNW